VAEARSSIRTNEPLVAENAVLLRSLGWTGVVTIFAASAGRVVT
jgi:hypothetical protein